METITMSGKERRRLEVLSRVHSGELSLVQGAELLGIRYRQVKRGWARYQEQGMRGWCIVFGDGPRIGRCRQGPRSRRWNFIVRST